MKTYITLILLCLLFLWNSCEIINPAEEIPSYIQIDSVSLVTNVNLQGSTAHKITDVQVSSENELLGIFPLPATIPVLREGTNNIKIDAFVIENGISATRELYPFYERYSESGELVRGEVLNIEPVFNYLDGTDFAFIENFNGSNLFVDDIDGDPGTRLEIVADGAFEGSGSGLIRLEETGSTAIVGTGIFYSLPTTGTPIFLEMNYKCNSTFTVGIRGIYTSGDPVDLPKVNLRAQETWNKLYISFDQEVSGLLANQYQIYIDVNKAVDVQFTEVYLDNLKLVYRQ